MAKDSRVHDLEYPSLINIHIFWDLATKKFESDSKYDQKHACDKAYRAATEAVDVLLFAHGKYVPIGTPEAHIMRTKYLVEIQSLITEGQKIVNLYSLFKDHLHGAAYYSGLDPRSFSETFKQVGIFIEIIENSIQN